MAKMNTAASKLLAKTKGRSAKSFKQSRKAVPRSQSRLPAGINNGIAVLSSVSVVDRNGMPRVLITGKVVSPEEFEGTVCRGLNATESHDLFDIKDKQGQVYSGLSYEDNEANFCGKAKIILGDEAVEGAKDVSEIIELLMAACEDHPQFVFHTWESKSGFVNTDIDRMVEEGGDVETEEEEYEGEEEEEEEAPVGYGSLGSEADDGDEAAQEGLTEAATAVGIDPDDYGTWAELQEAIEEAEGGEEGEEEEEIPFDEEEEGDEGDEEVEEEEEEAEGDEEGEEIIPEKGDIFGFAALKGKAPQPCEVTASYTKKETANLKRESDGKLFKNVPWDRLILIEE